LFHVHVGSRDERGWVRGRGRRTFGKMHVSGTVLLVRSKKKGFYSGKMHVSWRQDDHSSRTNPGLPHSASRTNLASVQITLIPAMHTISAPKLIRKGKTASSDSLGNLLAPPVPQRCPPLESSVVCTKNHWTTARRKKNLAQTNNYGVGPCHLSRSPSVVRPGYRTGHASCRRNCAVRGADVIRARLR
jgi:hypothetical protein